MPRMAPSRPRCCSRRACFNGASASMPRMGHEPGGLRAARVASTGPRHRCRGWRQASSASQASRAASTGPRHRCRGWVERPLVGAVRRRLQRGLGIDAEDGCCGDVPEPSIGMLQRGLGIDAEDGNRTASGGASSRMLQRGLGIDAEDGLLNLVAQLPEVAASTGPRHRCRGWERLPPDPRRRRPCFNGASASMPRMDAGHRSDQRRRRGASTGPRHRCRGWPRATCSRFRSS